VLASTWQSFSSVHTVTSRAEIDCAALLVAGTAFSTVG
jgi:hypothetical protein